ncbi:MAG: UDP-N-acetylglucosamine 2-epimerase, partial [Propionicimonas sp.]|nr:UDP-N-acetylglucosamine 2-epimerase [Propionicimonas sp.]
RELSLPVVFVAHPRTRAAIERFGVAHLLADTTVVHSLTHDQFLHLARAATLLVSDSGGIQEECTVLKKPLIVPRRSTERPEAATAGFSRIVGPEESISTAARRMLSDAGLLRRLSLMPSPYGDGTASRRIAAICRRIADGVEAELPEAA